MITDRDEFGKEGTGAKLNLIVRRQRAVMANKRSWAEFDATVTVYREGRAIVDDTAVAQHQLGTGVEKQTTASTDTNAFADGDAWMD